MQQVWVEAFFAGNGRQHGFLLIGQCRRGAGKRRSGGTARRARPRRIDAAQPCRQGGEHDFAQRRMVVGCTELA